MNKEVIKNYLKENNIKIDDKSSGIAIGLNNNEIIIKGNSMDLIEFADYLVSLALSENSRDHLHLDELTLINSNSDINNLIIEKD